MRNKETAIEVFKGIINTKVAVTTEFIVNQIKEGNVDPAYIGVVLKKFSKIQETLDKKHKDTKQIIQEATLKYKEGNSKTFELYGVKVQERERGYWDYSQTEDPVLERLKNIEKEVKTQIKAREDELKAKAAAYNSTNKVENILSEGIKSFVVHVDALPELVWKEAIADIETNPPVKMSTSSLAYYV